MAEEPVREDICMSLAEYFFVEDYCLEDRIISFTYEDMEEKSEIHDYR
jgi:hypothetical protein